MSRPFVSTEAYPNFLVYSSLFAPPYTLVAHNYQSRIFLTHIPHVLPITLVPYICPSQALALAVTKGPGPLPLPRRTPTDETAGRDASVRESPTDSLKGIGREREREISRSVSATATATATAAAPGGVSATVSATARGAPAAHGAAAATRGASPAPAPTPAVVPYVSVYSAAMRMSLFILQVWRNTLSVH
jgi:hypothetical protein